MTPSYGHKALGLLGLPEGWTPPFVAISAEQAAALGADDVNEIGSAQISSRLRTSEVGPALQSLFAVAARGVLVRSSAAVEEMAARGRYRSAAAGFPSFVTVGELVKTVWTHAAVVDATSTPIPIVVQARVEPLINGHLSNECRLRKDRRDWVIEMTGAIATARTLGIRAQATERPSSLSCDSPDLIRQVLRAIAGAYTDATRRLHFEWLWDGERVWVVQCDQEPDLTTRRLPTAAPTASALDLSTFRRLATADDRFPKLRCALDYAGAGLPHANLWVLQDHAVITALAAGEIGQELAADLQQLARGRAVVRTDVAHQEDDFEVLLPRTDSAGSAVALGEFLIETARSLKEGGVPLDRIAFITHPFIPADAGAWSLAAPKSSRVRIDATFGLPDGLLYYAHDSYEVDLRSRKVRRRLRCKSPIVACQANGTWTDQPLGSPWNWRAVLTDDEALEIAALSTRLAESLAKPVETMFFVRARDANPQRTIPWVHRTEDVRAVTVAATPSHFPSVAVELRSRDDAAHVRDVLREMSDRQDRLLVRLAPTVDLVHDRAFLADVIESLDVERCTVELAGSSLAHIYYELVRAGLQVTTVDPMLPGPSATVRFDKLVRDLIPEHIAARGERVRAYTATGDELDGLLKRKMIEESFEVAATTSTTDLIEELGDVLDVLTALCELNGTDLEAVAAWAERKRSDRGGFGRGFVLLETQDRSLEEAVATGGGPVPVSQAVGIEVERGRRSRTQDRFELSDELEVPYRVSGLAMPGERPTRVVVEGEEILISFRPTGVSLRRVGRVVGNPDQLTLNVW